jgi:hypothetical protein
MLQEKCGRSTCHSPFGTGSLAKFLNKIFFWRQLVLGLLYLPDVRMLLAGSAKTELPRMITVFTVYRNVSLVYNADPRSITQIGLRY